MFFRILLNIVFRKKKKIKLIRILSNIVFLASDVAEELRLRVADSTTINVEPQGNVKFAIWVSFMEIYNEQIFDLLDLTPIGKGKRRAALKMGDDKDKNPYVKGL